MIIANRFAANLTPQMHTPPKRLTVGMGVHFYHFVVDLPVRTTGPEPRKSNRLIAKSNFFNVYKHFNYSILFNDSFLKQLTRGPISGGITRLMPFNES